jgi:hypothetical protein
MSDVPVFVSFDLSLICSEFARERKKMHKLGRQSHPAAKAASLRAYKRLHRIINEKSQEVHGLIMVADGFCGNHAAVVVLFPKNIPRQEMFEVACDHKAEICMGVLHAVPEGEWYKGYCPDPIDATDQRRLW